MSKIVKIYDSVIEQIKAEMIHVGGASEELKKQKEAYVAGLKLSLQILENEQDFVYGEYAYEKFEEILLSYLDEETNQSTDLDVGDMEDIIAEHMGHIS